jgi:hypothetical protein
MVAVEHHRIAAVEPEGDAELAAIALAMHFDGAEGSSFHIDVELLGRRDEHVAAVGLAPQDRREEADHGWPIDTFALVIPRAVAGDPHVRMAASLGIPLIHRRKPPLVDQLLKLGEADPLQVDRRAALGHLAVIARSAATKQSSMRGWIASLRWQ